MSNTKEEGELDLQNQNKDIAQMIEKNGKSHCVS